MGKKTQISQLNNMGLSGLEQSTEMRDFVDGIHKCQDCLALRAVRRAYPEGWPNHAQVTPQTVMKKIIKRGI